MNEKKSENKRLHNKKNQNNDMSDPRKDLKIKFLKHKGNPLMENIYNAAIEYLEEKFQNESKTGSEA